MAIFDVNSAIVAPNTLDLSTPNVLRVLLARNYFDLRELDETINIILPQESQIDCFQLFNFLINEGQELHISGDGAKYLEDKEEASNRIREGTESLDMDGGIVSVGIWAYPSPGRFRGFTEVNAYAKTSTVYLRNLSIGTLNFHEGDVTADVRNCVLRTINNRGHIILSNSSIGEVSQCYPFRGSILKIMSSYVRDVRSDLEYIYSEGVSEVDSLIMSRQGYQVQLDSSPDSRLLLNGMEFRGGYNHEENLYGGYLAIYINEHSFTMPRAIHEYDPEGSPTPLKYEISTVHFRENIYLMDECGRIKPVPEILENDEAFDKFIFSLGDFWADTFPDYIQQDDVIESDMEATLTATRAERIDKANLIKVHIRQTMMALLNMYNL